jgi:hypothetical protein
MTRLEVEVNGSMFWYASEGEMKGARASLEVRSKAIGGDLARLGGAGGVPAWVGEADDMISRGVSEVDE